MWKKPLKKDNRALFVELAIIYSTYLNSNDSTMGIEYLEKYTKEQRSNGWRQICEEILDDKKHTENYWKECMFEGFERFAENLILHQMDSFDEESRAVLFNSKNHVTQKVLKALTELERLGDADAKEKLEEIDSLDCVPSGLRYVFGTMCPPRDMSYIGDEPDESEFDVPKGFFSGVPKKYDVNDKFMHDLSMQQIANKKSKVVATANIALKDYCKIVKEDYLALQYGEEIIAFQLDWKKMTPDGLVDTETSEKLLLSMPHGQIQSLAIGYKALNITFTLSTDCDFPSFTTVQNSNSTMLRQGSNCYVPVITPCKKTSEGFEPVDWKEFAILTPVTKSQITLDSEPKLSEEEVLSLHTWLGGSEYRGCDRGL